MKLLLVTGIFPPEIGGPATYVPMLAMDAKDRFEQVSVVTLGSESRRTSNRSYELLTVSRTLPKPLRILKTIIVLVGEIRNSDAIFCNGLYIETSLVLRFLPRNSVAKIVGDPVWEKARNSLRTSLEIYKFQQSKWSYSDKIVNYVFCKAWASFDKISCPSPALAKLIETRLKNKEVIYIPNGVDPQPKIKLNKEHSLVTVSRLVSWKNIQCVIEAADLLGYKLKIIGEGPERSMLEKLAKDKNIDASFLGSLPTSAVLKNLETSRFFIQVSDYEGLSFSLLEAMACGVVPIVSGNEGHRNVVEDQVNGAITNIDGSSIARAIRSIDNQPGLYERLSNEAIRTVLTKFNGKSNRTKMLDLLEPTK